MSEEKIELQATPELKLDTAPTAPGAPELTLDAASMPSAPAISTPRPDDMVEKSNLTPAEQKQVDDFAEKINIHDTNVIVQYGSGAQNKMTTFSEGVLNNVRSKDFGEVGEMLTGLTVQLKSFSLEETEKSGFFGGLFKKASNRVTAMKVKYDSAEQNVNQIVKVLEQHQVTLMKDIAMLDKMYEQNVVYFKELTMYILAGKKKLAEVERTEVPALREKANASGLAEDAQAVNDLVNLCNRFSRKLHDLELTRTIALQTAPQIRQLQDNDTTMADRIQSTLVNTIPLWKNQMVLALSTVHSQQAAKAQRDVTDMTNELLRKNSETLKMATVETAKESERGIVDMETLQQTNRNLIEMLDEVVRIQNEGREKRAQAEVELGRIETELKNKLLQMRN